MRENEPVLLVLSVCDGEIILEKGEILCEKCQIQLMLAALPSLFVISPFFSNHAQLHFSTAIRFFPFHPA
jgi:hypothetical protein